MVGDVGKEILDNYEEIGTKGESWIQSTLFISNRFISSITI